ncbi:MAG: pyruvate kinase [Anaerolineae bacterium]|nr:pyruvate kinase [Phycisphaerae bacterium]
MAKLSAVTIRTKILATLGPATSDADSLFRLFEAGCDACRLNFSHGTLDQHLLMLRNIREAAARWMQPVAVLGDLCGPKIRLGAIADERETGGMPMDVGDQLVIQRKAITGGAKCVSSTYPALIDDVKVGDRLLVEDGLIRFICTDKTKDELRCSTTVGGVLKTAKGINLPNTTVSLPSISDRDWECVNWAIENDLDYLALSFVRSADDIKLLREHLRNHVSDIHVIAKIEKAEALANIDAIVEVSDGLMIARGDLGVEIDLARVPIVQKELIIKCLSAAKPVIVATQMLQSMVEHASPTRAEVSDVANAIIDGTDSVMLSGETSVGKFPIGAVVTMSHIAEVTEEYLASQPPRNETAVKLKTMHLSAATARGVRQIANDLAIKLVVVYSPSGATARIFSKNRFSIPIIALSNDHRALRRMALHYGVIPQESPPPADMDSLVAQIDALVQERKFATPGMRIIIVAGSSMGSPGTMNSVIIHTVGDENPLVQPVTITEA